MIVISHTTLPLVTVFKMFVAAYGVIGVLHAEVVAAQFFFCKSVDSHEVDRLSFSLVILRGKVHGVEGAAAAFPVV